jgi:hypothetical protein
MLAVHMYVVYISARRPAIRPPNPDALANGEILACSYFLAVADSIDGLPPLYPLDLLPGPVEMLAVIRVALDGPAGTDDPIAAVLFRWPMPDSGQGGAGDTR